MYFNTLSAERKTTLLFGTKVSLSALRRLNKPTEELSFFQVAMNQGVDLNIQHIVLVSS